MRYLVCHAYEVVNGQPGKLCRAMIDLIFDIHHRYDRILLLGGQHLPAQGTKTVDQVMKEALKKKGVPDWRLIAWSDLCPLQRPPRDTMEEVDVLPMILQVSGYCPKQVTFDVACIWFFKWRIRFLYRNRGAKVGRIWGAPSFDLKRMLIELVAYLATRIAPDGNSEIIRRNRAKRNVFAEPAQGWRDNLPSAWN